MPFSIISGAQNDGDFLCRTQPQMTRARGVASAGPQSVRRELVSHRLRRRGDGGRLNFHDRSRALFVRRQEGRHRGRGAAAGGDGRTDARSQEARGASLRVIGAPARAAPTLSRHMPAPCPDRNRRFTQIALGATRSYVVKKRGRLRPGRSVLGRLAGPRFGHPLDA